MGMSRKRPQTRARAARQQDGKDRRLLRFDFGGSGDPIVVLRRNGLQEHPRESSSAADWACRQATIAGHVALGDTCRRASTFSVQQGCFSGADYAPQDIPLQSSRQACSIVPAAVVRVRVALLPLFQNSIVWLP